jgi:hypothetical protein
MQNAQYKNHQLTKQRFFLFLPYVLAIPDRSNLGIFRHAKACLPLRYNGNQSKEI